MANYGPSRPHRIGRRPLHCGGERRSTRLCARSLVRMDLVLDSSTRPTSPGRDAGSPPDALHRVALDLFTAEDAGDIAGVALTAAAELRAVSSASLWVPVGESLECRAALGNGAEALDGACASSDEISGPLPGEDEDAVLCAGIATDGQLAAVLRITRAASDGTFDDAEHETLRFLADAAGVAMSTAQRLAAATQEAADRSRDLAAVTEMSREITATLDLDRVLRAAVNLATRVLTFDRGAIALYDRGTCDIRAVAGADGVDPRNPALEDLAVRAAWAAGSGEGFYLSDRNEPASDAEATFVQVFGEDLERDRAASGLYLPLKDEEGVVGIMVFEAERVEFASPHERELAHILANQTTVALRNAQLYRQVPLADTLGALAARKRAVLAVPLRRRALYAAFALAVLAGVTLVRWPLRVIGIEPVLRPLGRADVRSVIAGNVDRVFVTEGMTVSRGASVAHLRDDELRAERDVTLASATAADVAAATAAARGDAAGERLQRVRSATLRRAVDVLDAQIAAATLRSPAAGVVLTPRPEERVDTHVQPGELFVTVGRTDSLEVDFGVPEQDVTRVRAGDEIRLRVTALPQQTFAGVVTFIGVAGTPGADAVRFPVRAVVANEAGLMKPGMEAYARVLTAPASLVGRVFRGPLRAARLLWWRMWS